MFHAHLYLDHLGLRLRNALVSTLKKAKDNIDNIDSVTS
jgi:hypothetical protein